jgi:hypothetical protein
MDAVQNHTFCARNTLPVQGPSLATGILSVDMDFAEGPEFRNVSTFLTSCIVLFARQCARQGWHGTPKGNYPLVSLLQLRFGGGAFPIWRLIRCRNH